MVESCERIDRVVLRGLPCWPSASCIPPCFFSTLGLTNHTRQQKRQRLVAQEQQFPRPDDYLKLRRAASHEFTSGRSVVRSIFLVSTSWTRIANDHKDTIQCGLFRSSTQQTNERTRHDGVDSTVRAGSGPGPTYRPLGTPNSRSRPVERTRHDRYRILSGRRFDRLLLQLPALRRRRQDNHERTMSELYLP
jgi:hypothetical protein